MTKVFTTSKGKNEDYSTYIEVINQEVIDFSCSCPWGSWFGLTKKNGSGTKPCIHVKKLIERYNKAKEEIKNEKISMDM